MEIKMALNLDGLTNKLASLAAAAADPSVALLRCGGVVRAHAERAFEQEGPGWQRLAPATEARKITAQEIDLLAKDAKGKSGLRTVEVAARALTRAMERSDNAATEKLRAKWEKKIEVALANVETIEKRFQSRRLPNFAALQAYAERERARAKYHGENQRIARKMALADGESWGEYKYKVARGKNKGQERTGKYVVNASLERRRMRNRGKRRYQAESGADRILGKLDKSISMKLEARRVRIFSHARIGGIHNVGGVAGKGAKIPARPFMYIPEDGPVKFRAIVKEALTGAMVK